GALALLLSSGQVERRLIGVIEEREKLVILALRKGVELVVVALGAADCQAKKDAAGGVHAIDDRFDAELLEVYSPFLVDERIAVEAGGDLLRQRRAGEQIAGNLLDGELVEGEIAIQGIDDPVAVLPDRPRGIDIEPV